ncbi:MAG TPA: (2Fe-2S)-binding protein [Acidimicrobiia bacterium]|nr:(2Fe-2S)-binding protein [Acidimicrobiia bacterium]
MELHIIVNGRRHDLDVAPDETLLQTIRNRLGLLGTKEGCVEGECGACTMLVEGVPVDSCLYPSPAAEGFNITTIEGIGAGATTPLQEAMVRAGAVQCGFCTPGFVVTLTALLADNPAPSEYEVRSALSGNLCRCTGYAQIIDAVIDTVGSRR